MRFSFYNVLTKRSPHLRNEKLILSVRSTKKDDFWRFVQLLVNAKAGSINYAKRSKFKCLPFVDLVFVDGLVNNYRLALCT
jgi:hypothetical protein